MPVNVTGGGLEFDATIDGSQFQRQINAIERDLNRLASTTEQRGAELEGIFKKAATAAASFFSIQAAGGFIKQLVEVRGQFEQLEVAYSTILKSKVKGDALFKETIGLAATTPFNLTEVAQSTKQLLAYGVAAKDVTGTLRMLGDVAAGVSAPIGDIAYLYGTLKTQGRAYMMDIRQFTGRGIPIIAELAKQFHVTEGEVNKLVEAGKVGFPEVEKAFQSLTGSGGIFFNLMQQQSQTLTGRLSNLQDAFAQMLNNLGKANSGILNDGITGLANLVDNYKAVLDVIELLVVAYGVYKAVIVVTTALQALQAAGAAKLTASELLHYGALTLVQKAQTALNSSMVVGTASAAAFTAVITALIAIVYAFATSTDRASESQKNLQDIIDGANKSTLTQQNLVESLNRTATDLNKTEALRLAAVNKLRDIMPDRLKGYTDEQIEAGKAKKAIDEYTQALVKNARLAAANSKITDLQSQLLDLDTEGFAAIPTADRLSGSLTKFGGSLLDAVTGKGLSSFATNDQVQLAEYKAQIKGEIEDIRKIYGAGIDDLNAVTEEEAKKPGNSKNAAFFQKIIDDNTASLKALDKSAADFKQQAAKYKKNIADAKNELKAFDPDEEKKNNDAYQRELERRNDLLRSIYELNQKYVAKSATDDQAKLQAISDDFDKLKAKIDAYNSNPKNRTKISSNVVTNIGNKEFNAISSQADLNENDFIQKDIEKKKQLYTEYEDYREKLGKESADKQYADLLRSGDSFLTYIKNISKANAENVNNVTAGALEARKEFTDKYTADAVKDENAKNLELLTSSLTYEQQRTINVEKYLKKAADLRADGHQKEAAQAIKNGQDELTALDEQNIQKLDAYKELFDGILVLSTKRAKQDIAAVQKYIDAGLKAGTITKEAYDKINKQLKEATKNVKSDLPTGLRNIASGFGDLANSVGQFDSELANALGTLGNMLNSVASIKENFNSIKSPDTDVFGKISAGLGMLGAGLGIISTIGGLFSNAKQNAEQQKYTTDLQIKSTQAVNKLLERQLALTKEIYGPERLTAYKKGLDDIAKAQADANSKLNGKLGLSGNKVFDEQITKLNNGEKINELVYGPIIDFLKASGQAIDLTTQSLEQLTKLMDEGKLDDRTAAIVQSLIDLKQQAKDTANALTEEITGINFDSLNDEIRSIFDGGEASAEKFADAIEKSIRGAFSNAFKRNEIEKAMQPFYDQLYKAGQDGVFSEQEIAELRSQKEAIAKLLADKAAAYEAIIGKDDTISEDSTLTGQVKAAITEDTASIIAGTLKGTQLNTYSINQQLIKDSQTTLVFNQGIIEANAKKLYYLERIDNNTKRSADNSDSLKDIKTSLDSIDKKMNSASNTLAANGRGI